MNRKLSSIYYNPSDPASFAGSSNLIKSVQGKYTAQAVRKWLTAQDAYTMHKPRRKKFPRNKYRVSNIDDLHQADLNDMRSLSRYNDGYKYILTIIDVFSRYAWAVPLIDKKPSTIISAFNKVFNESKRKPLHLQTDKGSEFVANSVRKFLRDNDIKYYVSQNPDVKACLVERLNRTLKTRMYRYFTHRNTYRYVEMLPKLLTAYNSTIHSATKFAPKNVNETNILHVWRNQYGKQLQQEERERHIPKFRVGDTVRISREKNMFQKGYENNFSEEIFKIKKVLNRKPIVYRLYDLNNEDIEGVFYEQELQKVTVKPTKTFKIDKVIATRGSGIRKEVFVKWKGYPNSFNTWISAKDIKNI